MKYLHKVAFLLLLVGGLNWLLYAIFGWEISRFLGGMDGIVAKLLYVLIGLSAVYEIVMHKKTCRDCDAGSSAGGSSASAASPPPPPPSQPVA